MKWIPHGESDVTSLGNIIKNNPKGYFNAEGILRAWDLIFDLVEKNEFESWYLIEDLEEGAHSIPEALDILRRMYMKAETLNCKGLCVIHKDFLQVSDIEYAVNETNIKIKYVKSVQEAIDYFKENFEVHE